MNAPAAVGFRAHSGWAAAVAVASSVVILRRRIEMGLAQPYHAAAQLEKDEAAQLIAHHTAAAASLATAALRVLIQDVRGLGHQVVGCGLLLAAGRPLPALDSILASHALIHAAEGELFREALRAAAAACGLPLTSVKERDLRIEPSVEAMGKGIGPPWRQDQKLAAAAALLALRRG